MTPADSADTTGKAFPPIPDHVRRLADAAVAAQQPGTRRVLSTYLAWLEKEVLATRSSLGLSQPHRMANGREVMFTPVHGPVNALISNEPDPLPRSVGVLALIGLLESV